MSDNVTPSIQAVCSACDNVTPSNVTMSHLPYRLVALLVVVPCSAFPRAGRLTNDEIHQHVREKGSAKTR